MKFVWYSDWGQLPESANALFEESEKDSIFYSRPWFENLATVLDDEHALVIACVEAGSKVLAILPLVMTSGNNFLSLKHSYATHYSFLLANENKQQILSCLIQGLEQFPVRSLLLEPVSSSDRRILDLKKMLEEMGYQCEQHFRLYNWIYSLSGQTFNDYMAARPARLRNTIARKKRKLEREQGYEIRLFTGCDVPSAMADYYAVYSASWKANEQYVEFLNGIVEGFSRPGWSRLAVLYVKEQPVAAQLWFVHRGKASIFRLSYDEQWKKYSPGSILTQVLMEYVIDIDKVEEIDFLTGNEPYKQDWMSDRRERFALSCIKKIDPPGWHERLITSMKRILNK